LYETLVLNLQSVSPSEFWQLTPSEAGLILDWHYEQQQKSEISQPVKKGLLTDEQPDRLETKRAKLRAKGLNVI
jgi:hypothetical protein